MSTDHCIQLLLQHDLEQNCAAPKKWFFDALHQIWVICAQITLHWKAKQGWERRSANLCGETGYSNVLIYARLFIEVFLQQLQWLEQNCAPQAQAHSHTSTQAHKHTGTQVHKHTIIQSHKHTSTQFIWAPLWISRCLNGSYNSCLWRPNFLAISSITLWRSWKSPVLCSLLHWSGVMLRNLIAHSVQFWKQDSY